MEGIKPSSPKVKTDALLQRLTKFYYHENAYLEKSRVLFSDNVNQNQNNFSQKRLKILFSF